LDAALKLRSEVAVLFQRKMGLKAWKEAFVQDFFIPISLLLWLVPNEVTLS
jgi:hypothetical protein